MPALTQRAALAVALVYVLLATVGEAFHYKHHEKPSAAGITSSVQSAHAKSAQTAVRPGKTKSLPAMDAPDRFCAVCQWEATFATAATLPVAFALCFAFSPLMVGYAEKPTFFVRLTLALRASRGPPSLALS